MGDGGKQRGLSRNDTDETNRHRARRLESRGQRRKTRAWFYHPGVGGARKRGSRQKHLKVEGLRTGRHVPKLTATNGVFRNETPGAGPPADEHNEDLKVLALIFFFNLT